MGGGCTTTPILSPSFLLKVLLSAKPAYKTKQKRTSGISVSTLWGARLWLRFGLLVDWLEREENAAFSTDVFLFSFFFLYFLRGGDGCFFVWIFVPCCCVLERRGRKYQASFRFVWVVAHRHFAPSKLALSDSLDLELGSPSLSLRLRSGCV